MTRRSSGLTSLELVLALALIALAASVAAVSSVRAAAASRARAGAEHLAALLRGAVRTAAAENTAVRVILTPGTWPPRVEAQRPRGGAWTDITSELSATWQAAAPAGRLRIVSTTYPDNIFVAGPDPALALVTASGGTVVIESGYGLSASVQTTRVGRVCVGGCQ